ncbi:MAG: DNA-binding protein [Coleofasciculaceae cyanobacterium SM2_3_26]|nr:DNA-binding protein [Coleofasciculaceae cyanobacterium SM2_3_26]
MSFGTTTLPSQAPVGTAAQAQSHLAQVSIGELQQFEGTTITGEVTAIFGNDFILSDGTGQILVGIGPEWYHQLPLQVGERVTVVGEVDYDGFDAFTITRQNGVVLNIRPAFGPPPWSGERRRAPDPDFPPIRSSR